jgi:hypothetical protein
MTVLRWRFIAEKAFTSRAIAWFGGGDWSHVDLIMPDGSFAGARSDVLKEIPAGYRVRPYDYIAPAREIQLSHEVTQAQADACYAASKAKEGAPYDELAIWGFIWGRNWMEPDSWICSEAQVDNGMKAALWGPLYLSANRITPNDFTLILTAVGATIP